MTRALIVDDTQLAVGLLAELVERELGWSVTTALRPDELPALLATGPPFEVAVVDLSFPNSHQQGLDALLALHDHHPSCRLVIYTDGDPPLADVLRDAWEAFDLATAISKSSAVPVVLSALRDVERTGRAPIDPVLLALLPAERSPWRTIEGYGRLVAHAGHAKLWQALIDFEDEPSYKQLSEHTGLELSTIRNYRSELLDELAIHYLDRPKMRQMQLFAKRCRPLLQRHIRRKLSPGRVPAGGS